jgi:alpha-amylase
MTQLGGNEAKAMTAAAIYLTLPGVPFLYYGEEIGMSGAKPDERIRTPMQWSGEANAGFSDAMPWQGPNPDYTTRNVAAQLADEGSLLRRYIRLIRLRSAYEALRTGELIPVPSGNIYVWAYVRHGEAEDVLVVHNLSDAPLSDYALAVRGSVLAPGTHRARDLLTGARAASLTVGEQGAIEGYVPVPELAAGQSLILLLQ